MYMNSAQYTQDPQQLYPQSSVTQPGFPGNGWPSQGQGPQGPPQGPPQGGDDKDHKECKPQYVPMTVEIKPVITLFVDDPEICLFNNAVCKPKCYDRDS